MFGAHQWAPGAEMRIGPLLDDLFRYDGPLGCQPLHGVPWPAIFARPIGLHSLYTYSIYSES